ncbi:MAG: hypothetical protein AB1405_11520 [Bdellovibrionota bacterium]
MNRLKPPVFLFLAALLVAGCEGDKCGTASLEMPSTVTILRVDNEQISIPGRLVPAGGFSSIAFLAPYQHSITALDGVGIVLDEDFQCGGVIDPPGCVDSVFNPLDEDGQDYLAWRSFVVEDMNQSTNSTDVEVDFGLFCLANSALIENKTVILQVRDARGTFTVGTPANVSLDDSDGAQAEVAVTVTPDTDFSEPVVACFDSADLPAGVEPVQSPWCDALLGDPTSSTDEIADVPGADTAATLVLEVMDQVMLSTGSYNVDVLARPLGIATDELEVIDTFTLDVVTP